MTKTSSGQAKRLLREVRLCEQYIGKLDYDRQCVAFAMTQARKDLRDAVKALNAYKTRKAARGEL